MSSKAPELEESIRLALEAAQAATDAAGEIGPMQHGIEIAVMRVENLRKFMTHAVIAMLGASVVIVAIAALVYFQTLSNMRTATATQIEATAVVTDSIEQMDLALGRTEALVAEIKELDALEGRLTEAMMAALEGQDQTVAAETSVQTLSVVKAALMQERKEIAALLSDMEMALSKLISTGFGVPSSAMPKSAEPEAKAPEPAASGSAAEAPKSTTMSPKPAPKTTAKSASKSTGSVDKGNPFKYP